MGISGSLRACCIAFCIAASVYLGIPGIGYAILIVLVLVKRMVHMGRVGHGGAEKGDGVVVKQGD